MPRSRFHSSTSYIRPFIYGWNEITFQKEPWSKSAQICGRFKSSAQIGRYSVGVGATKVWRFYVSATSATNVALVWHQKGGLTRSLDDLGIMHLRCTSIAIPHKPQSSILSSQSSLYHKVWYIYVCTTCTTNVAQVWYILTPVPQSEALLT